MSAKSPRLKAQEKDDASSLFLDMDFADYKKGASATVIPVAFNQRTSAPVAPKFEMTLEKDLLPYFREMVALDDVFEKLTKSLAVFLHRNDEHCTFSYWSGGSLTGKTTLAKRFAGQEGFSAYSARGSKTFYLDCFSVKDGLETLKNDWLDKSKTPNNSIIFIDEAEKCFDEAHKLVDDVFAKKFRKVLEDLSRTRKLFFVFISQESPKRENVQRIFGMKLTSLMDFDLKFPEWTTENLLNIILESIDLRGYKIEPRAAANLAAHVSQHGMVLEMRGVLQLIDVELKRSGQTMITERQVTNILRTRS